MSKPTMHHEAWRVFRILSEFVMGFETMTDLGPSVSIFGSARTNESDPYYKLCVDIAHKIAQKGLAVITGGGPGIMEAGNRGATEAQGRSCGLSISLPFESNSNPYVDKKFRLSFRYFFVRKVMFIRYAQAFVFMPGGYGTLDELFEALTLIQTNKIRPFPIFLIGTKYWSGLLDWMKEIVLKNKNIDPQDLDLITLTDDPDLVADAIEKHFKASGLLPTYDLSTSRQNLPTEEE